MDYIGRMAQVRKLRKETQQQTADFLGIPQQQYSRYENRKHEIPVRYLIELCKHWRISADWLLGIHDLDD